MLIDNIFLDHASAALYTGFTLLEINYRFVSSAPISLRVLSKLCLWEDGDDYILCLKQPTGGFIHALRKAASPVIIQPDLLNTASEYLLNAPFLLSAMDVLYFLNEKQLYNLKPMDSMALALSEQNFWSFYAVRKADAVYKGYLAKINAAEIIE